MAMPAYSCLLTKITSIIKKTLIFVRHFLWRPPYSKQFQCHGWPHTTRRSWRTIQKPGKQLKTCVKIPRLCQQTHWPLSIVRTVCTNSRIIAPARWLNIHDRMWSLRAASTPAITWINCIAAVHVGLTVQSCCGRNKSNLQQRTSKLRSTDKTPATTWAIYLAECDKCVAVQVFVARVINQLAWLL